MFSCAEFQFVQSHLEGRFRIMAKLLLDANGFCLGRQRFVAFWMSEELRPLRQRADSARHINGIEAQVAEMEHYRDSAILTARSVL